MSENKFSKFAVNYITPEKDAVYSYTALDEENDCVLVIRPCGQFDLEIPATIQASVGTAFKFSDADSEEITAQQFWKIFKSHTLKLYEYYQNQLEKIGTDAATPKQR